MAVIETGSNTNEISVAVINNSTLATKFNTEAVKNLTDLKSQIAAQGVNVKNFDFADQMGRLYTKDSQFEQTDLIVNMVKRKTKAGMSYKENKQAVKAAVNCPRNGNRRKDLIKNKFGKNWTQLSGTQMEEMANFFGSTETVEEVQPEVTKEVTEVTETKKKSKKKDKKKGKKGIEKVVNAVKGLIDAVEITEEDIARAIGTLKVQVRKTTVDKRLLMVIESLEETLKSETSFLEFHSLLALKRAK